MPSGQPYPKERLEEALRLWKDTDLPAKLICTQAGIGIKTLYRVGKGIPRTFLEEQEKARPQPAAESNGHSSVPRATQKTTEPGRAIVLSIIPQRFELVSSNFWQAKAVCEQIWKWAPRDPGQWLDEFLYQVFKERGVLLGAVQILTDQVIPGPEEGDHDDTGRGIPAADNRSEGAGSPAA